MIDGEDPRAARAAHAARATHPAPHRRRVTPDAPASAAHAQLYADCGMSGNRSTRAISAAPPNAPAVSLAGRIGGTASTVRHRHEKIPNKTSVRSIFEASNKTQSKNQ
ncbi:MULTISPECIES: hypothetical protein [Burkholderia]|uniref:hypothetical protein n=1 Tax=Burkholderia TaxID=32008 RepID=UPI000A4557AD|nr:MULTISPECIES: hypothetical protein [Burkholderia]